MKIVVLVARVLLGLIFFVFGLNNILHFLPMPAPTGDALQYMTVLSTHGFFRIIGLLMIVSGLLLLVGRFVPLALTLLAPIIVNILLYHTLLEPSGAAAAIAVTVLEVFLIVIYRKSFYTLFYPAPEAL